MTGSTSSAVAARQPAPTRLSARALVLLVFVVLLWGASYPTMKAAALEIPILTFRGWAAVAPGLVLLALARAGGHPLHVPRPHRPSVILTGFFTVTLTHTLTNFSTLHIAAGQTSIMLYTMPLWAFIIGIPVLGERPTHGHWAGLALGTGGMTLLWLQTAGGGISPGVLIGLAGAVSWACGTIAAKSASGHVSPLVLTGWMFVIGGIPLCLMGLAEIDRIGPVSPIALLSALFVVFGCNLVGFLGFFVLIKQVPAIVASLSVLAVPGVAFAGGLVMLGEAMTVLDALAFALLAGALITVLPRPATKRRTRSGP